VDSSGTRTWELHDALGSVRQTLDDAGNPIYASGYGYTPFGVPQSGAQPAPFGFTGELHRGGLQYLRARWYDPAAGAPGQRCRRRGLVAAACGEVGEA
jgi:hypothetical protein